MTGTKRYLLLLCTIGYLVNRSDETLYAQGAMTENAEFQWKVTTICGSRGNLEVLSKLSLLTWQDGKGVVSTREALMAVSPSNGVVWVGLPGSHLLEVNGEIMGVAALHDTLVVRVSTNRLNSWHPSDNVSTLETKMNVYEAQLDGQSVAPSGTQDKRIRLRDIFGHAALMDMQSAAPPETPQILGVECEGRTIVLQIKSGIGKTLTLVLDDKGDPVKGAVAGSTVFERGKIAPPSLQDELKGGASFR